MTTENPNAVFAFMLVFRGSKIPFQSDSEKVTVYLTARSAKDAMSAATQAIQTVDFWPITAEMFYEQRDSARPRVSAFLLLPTTLRDDVLAYACLDELEGNSKELLVFKK